MKTRLIDKQLQNEMLQTINAHALSYVGGKAIDSRIIYAMTLIPRHHFVGELAYEDMPVPIGHGQTISQPFIVAYMTDMLQLQPLHRVLEIGMGSGYQAAVLSELVQEVYTVERIKELYDKTAPKLKKYKNIISKVGDGYKGWKEFAPYDRIMVTAMADEIPVDLTKQLVVGGKMIIPVKGELLLVTKKKEIAGVPLIEQQSLIGVRFVPLVKELEDD